MGGEALTASASHCVSDEDEPLRQAAAWLDEGVQVALATLVGTVGSSP
jgi:hypothetical protein